MRSLLPVRASLHALVFAALATAAASTAAVGSKTFRATEKTLLPPKGYRLVLDDDFRTLSLWNGHTGTWEPGFWHGGRYDTTSGELEYYVDPRPGHDIAEVQAMRPFEITPQGLAITARPIPQDKRYLFAKQSYTSGLLSTRLSAVLSYGYVEIRAKIPKGRGLWPAFWMLPTDKTWPPEIDLLEAIGGEGPQYWATVHFGPTDPEGREMNKVVAPKLRDAFHDFGLLWTPEKIAWYYDGSEVASDPTPAILEGRPMYLILCMAIGGKWAKPPTDPATFPARLQVARVRMYAPGSPAAVSTN